MDDLARRLAGWATTVQPSDLDIDLADRALVDTVSVALAARHHPILHTSQELPRVERWAVAAHILDFDDLHLPSTSHISTVCVPVAVATGGGARAYLAGAGVMARLGTMLGHPHYTRGWHATVTAGTVAAAAVASRALGLDVEQTARALALAVPAAGGVQKAFGTDAKSLQVGGAAGAGLRAARLAARGASAATSALEEWVHLLGGNPTHPIDVEPGSDIVPGGLAIKLYPCCYALQRPIGATALLAHGDAGRGLRSGDSLRVDEIQQMVVRTPLSTIKPLIHDRPRTGLEGKFSLPYALATAVLDRYPGFDSFTDEAVLRPQAQDLIRLVEVQTEPIGDGLLAGEVEVEITTTQGRALYRIAAPPGAPDNPATREQLIAKYRACLGESISPEGITWDTAAALLDTLWPEDESEGHISTERMAPQHG